MSTGTVTIGEERVTDCLHDVRLCVEDHWRELALYQDDIALDPDYDLYVLMDKAGLLAPYMLRRDKALIGYAVYVVKGHPHYRNHKWAIADLFWLHPDHRDFGIGKQMFQFIEADLKKKGVEVMHTTSKIAHPKAAVLLEALGHVKVEVGHSKKL